VVFDGGTDKDRRALERLEHDMIGWLTTVTADGRPQTFPIWFLWEDGEALVYSDVRARRNENIAANPHVSLHLGDDGRGGDLVILEGEARVDTADPGPVQNEAYLAKYLAWLLEFTASPDEFAKRYHVAIRISPTRGRASGA